MRILMVHNGYAKPSGEEFAVAAFSRLLREHGHEVIAYRKSSADLAPGLAGSASAFFSGMYSFKAMREIDKLLDKASIDLVQVQNLYPQISPSILKIFTRRGIPVVMRCPNYRLFCPTGLHLSRGEICERCSRGHEWNCVLRNCAGSSLKSVGYALRTAIARRFRLIRNHVDIFIVLSEFQRAKFIANGISEDRLALVFNYEAAPSALPVQEDCHGKVVAFIGRPSEEKGVRVFIEAARMLPDIPFAITATSAELSKFTSRVPPNVTCTGFLNEVELAELYRKTRILIYAGIWYEGFPNVVASAFAQSRPVISSRIGAMPEIVIDNKTGLLFEAGNYAELADKIRQLYADLPLCCTLGAAGRARVQREFSPGAVYAQLMNAYERARQQMLMRSKAL